MPVEAAVNGGSTSLAAAISDTSATIQILAADVARLPNPPAGGQYHVAVSDGVNTELMTVTGGFGTATLNVTRASEPFNGVQQAFAFTAATVTHVLTLQALQGLIGLGTLSTGLLNQTGSTLNSGDVLVLSGAQAQSAVFASALDDAGGALVAVNPVPIGALGYFATIGRITRVNCLAGVTLGQWLTPSATPRLAAGTASKTTGTFARALTSEAGAGYVDALVLGGGGGGGGSVNMLAFDQQAVTGATVTLTPVAPASNGVLSVAVNGQTLTATRDYTVAGSVITFTTSLSADDVHVVYVSAQTFNSSGYLAHFEQTYALGTTVVTLPQTPFGIPLVTRGGVTQYQSRGHYSLLGNTITLADAIQAGEDGTISVDYWVAGGGAGDAASVNGLQAVSAAAAAPNRLVATDAATGLLPLGIIPQVSVAKLPTGIPNANLASDVARANLLTNGGFEIKQRAASSFTTDGYCLDRWYMGLGTGTHTVTQDGSVFDSGSQFSLKGVVTGTGSRIDQFVEIARVARNKTFTFAVRVLTSVANAVRLQVYDLDGATLLGSSPLHSGSGLWETLVLTFTPVVAPTQSTMVLRVLINASCTYYLDNATLVPGAVAADYVPLHPVDDIARCLRYYETLGGTPATPWPVMRGYGGAGIVMGMPFTFKVRKYAAPSITKGLGAWTVSNAGQPNMQNASADGFEMTTTVTALGGFVVYSGATDAVAIAEVSP